MTPAEIKASLPIPFVLERAGIAYEVDGEGRCHAVCPFHDDHRPSFDVFGEQLDVWGCFPCGKVGDVFDFIRDYWKVEDFITLADVGEWLVGVLRAEKWVGPVSAAPKREFDFADATRLVLAARRDLSGLEAFLKARTDIPGGAKSLHNRWGVGSVGQRIVIPYFDHTARRVVAYKHRTLESKPISAPGSSFPNLYGHWLDDGRKPVLLVEGESDAWAADWYLREHVAVLSVPNGAGTRPEKFEGYLAERTVQVCFDGDLVGRSGAERWATVTGGIVLPVPEGDDVAALGAAIRTMVLESLPSVP